MTTETFSTRFVYSGDSERVSLGAIVDALTTHGSVQLREDLDEESLEDWTAVPYEYGPLIGSIKEAADPHGRPVLRIPQSTVSPFADDDHDVDAPACRHLIDLTAFLYETLPSTPILVCSTSPAFEAGSPIPDLDRDGTPSFPRRFTTWLDVYTPAEVEAIGREKVLSTPAPRVDELADGSVLIASKHPLAASEERLDAVSDHLGIPTWLDQLY